LKDVLKEYGVEQPPPPTPGDVPGDAVDLFKIRYQVDREIRRIWERRMGGGHFARPHNVGHMLSDLANEGYVDFRLVGAIRDLYAVASAAIHGQPVSDAQRTFVADLAPGLLATLRSLHRDGAA
jgi:hypothetical protein